MGCCGQGQSVPGIVRAAQAVANGVTGLANVVLRRGIAPSATIASRRAICAACEKNVMGVCEACFCITAAKTSLIQEHCPDNPPRW